ncbi:small-multidrug export protein, partial [Candidatus Acetothermia bacterium]
GNLTVVPILFLGLRSGERLLRRTTFGRRLVDSVFARVRRRASAIDRYGALGLFLLVAIPLPGTGAWTGAIAASFFGIPPRRASIPIVLGVLAAGIVVLLASLGVIRVVTIL